MALVGSYLPWGVDFATGWIALVVVNLTTPMHDELYSYPKEKYCAGAFLGGSWFLTSASCFEPFLPEPQEVTVMTGWGDFDCSQIGPWAFKSIGIEIELHPGDAKNPFVDLAMVRTRRTAYSVPKGKLSPSVPHNQPDSKCRLLSFDDEKPRKAGFMPVTAAECLQENQICTEIEIPDVKEIHLCPGKLGGVLECDGQLTGVLTQALSLTSRTCDLAGHVQVFEDVGQHRKWIQETIQQTRSFIYDKKPPKGWKDMDADRFANLLREDDLWTAHLKKEFRDVEDRDRQMSEDEFHDENILLLRTTLGSNLNLYIAVITIGVFCLMAAIYFCHVQLHRFDHHIDI